MSVHLAIDRISEWHDFDPTDGNSYPLDNGRVQVKYAGGRLVETDASSLKPEVRVKTKSPVIAWRCVKTGYF
jgi:hypothetical protein